MNNVLNNTSTERFRKTLDYSKVGVIPPYVPSTKEYDMSRKRILGLFGDQGGFNAGIPVLTLAHDQRCSVQLHFVGPSRKLYLDGKLNTNDIEILATDSVEDATPDILVIGASHSEEGVRGTMDAMRAINCPVIAIEDMYGSMNDILSLQTPTGPRFINTVCVIDEFAKEMLVNKHLIMQDHTFVTGGPQFDKVAEMTRTNMWEERGQLLRDALGDAEDRFVFLIVGGLNGTAEILDLLETAIERANLEQEPVVILRDHPRATEQDKQLTKEFFGRTKHQSWFKDVSRDLAKSSDDLLPAADFVLSGYSTTNHFGILCQMPGVVYVGTPAFRADHLKEKGTEVPPQVKAGAGWYVQSPEDMVEVIAICALNQRNPRYLDIVKTQALIAQYNDGHATDRVWQQMQQLMA